METGIMFLDCPAYMDRHGAARCGLPAEVESWYTVRSTDGPLESAKIRCPRGHWFNGPVESLTWDKHQDAAAARPAETGRRDAAGQRHAGSLSGNVRLNGDPQPAADPAGAARSQRWRRTGSGLR
jgi:hypothetical protein